MKQAVYLFISFLGLLGCSGKPQHYNYIKILTITKADSVTDINKGLKTGNYLCYYPEKNYAVFRFVQPAQPDTFHTYTGYFQKKQYADTISALVALLKHHKEGFIPFTLDSNVMYCGPYYYVEYSDSTGIHYNQFIIDANDTLNNFDHFFYDLEKLPWKKVLVNNNFVDETGEMINMLKATGSYERIVKPYVPLPCKKGIELDKIFGSWRTIGDEYMDTSYKYDVYKIDTTGTLTLYTLDNEKVTQEVIVKIKSIKDNIIETVYNRKIDTLEIINLTDNCFEFRIESIKHYVRLDRLR